ncbi:3102_t:CDS:2 [Rhizophagus irregularis]|nr:3102_t:CDS:2 [Rhizophagus irregularis]
MASKDYQVDYYINSLIIDRLIEVNIAGKILMDMIVKGQGYEKEYNKVEDIIDHTVTIRIATFDSKKKKAL